MTKTITEKDLTLKDLSLIRAIQKNKSIDVFKRSFALSKYGGEKSYDGTFHEHDSTFHTWDVAVDLMNLLDDDNGTIGEMNRLMDIIYNVDTIPYQVHNKIGEGTPVISTVVGAMFLYDGGEVSYRKIQSFFYDHMSAKRVSIIENDQGIPIINISLPEKKEPIYIVNGQHVVINLVTKDVLAGYDIMDDFFKVVNKEDLQFVNETLVVKSK